MVYILCLCILACIVGNNKIKLKTLIVFQLSIVKCEAHGMMKLKPKCATN
jgi:hypothetical protein